jgi:hypothetical protein
LPRHVPTPLQEYGGDVGHGVAQEYGGDVDVSQYGPGGGDGAGPGMHEVSQSCCESVPDPGTHLELTHL